MSRTSFPWEQTSESPSRTYNPYGSIPKFPWESGQGISDSRSNMESLRQRDTTRFPWEHQGTSSRFQSEDVFRFGGSSDDKLNTNSHYNNANYENYNNTLKLSNNRPFFLDDKFRQTEGLSDNMFRGEQYRSLFDDSQEESSELSGSTDNKQSFLFSNKNSQETSDDIIARHVKSLNLQRERATKANLGEVLESEEKADEKQLFNDEKGKEIEREVTLSQNTTNDQEVVKPEANLSQEEEEKEAKKKSEEGEVKEEEELKEDEDRAKAEDPVVTAPGSRRLSRSSSLARLAAKREAQQQKVSPVVPKHINKKSEMLAKNYMSAYARPKIAPKKEEKECAPVERKNYRKQISMDEWVYPLPTENPDWKAKSDAEVADGSLKRVGSAPVAAPPDRSVSSASLREDAFLKWVDLKRNNKTLKKRDLHGVVVLKDVSDVPKADEIMQEKFADWYRTRAFESDKKKKETEKVNAQKKKEAAELAEEKKRQEQINRKIWEEKDKERKKQLKLKKDQEVAKQKEKDEAESERRMIAVKSFNNWKNAKDPILQEKAKKKRQEEKKKREDERNDKEMKEMEAQKSFKKWKEDKEKEMIDKKGEAVKAKRHEEHLHRLAVQARENERNRALQQWSERKALEANSPNKPADHVTPWRNGTGTGTVTSTRDEKLMADLAYKKMKNKTMRKTSTPDLLKAEIIK